MIIFQILASIVIFFIVGKTFLKYYNKKIHFQIAIFWILFWLAAEIVIILPQLSSFFASLLGIGRGADLVLYVGIGCLFYFLFRFYLKTEELQSQITVLSRTIALHHPIKKHLNDK